MHRADRPADPVSSPMTAARRAQLLRRIAGACALLVIVVTSLSAFIRLDRAGLGCADWPSCYGQPQPAAPDAVQPARESVLVARGLHRVAALATLVAVVAMLVLALGARPRLAREGALALALLALVLFLAVLGRFSSGARIPAVAIGNLLGGLGMVAIAARLARSRPWATLTAVATAALLLQAALGVLTSATFAATRCTDLAGCWHAAQGIGWHTLDPWREPLVGAGGGAAEPGALAQLLHRLGGFVAAAAVGVVGVGAWRRGRRAAAAVLVALLSAEAALGAWLPGAGGSLWWTTGHNAGAALLVAATARLGD